MTDEGAWSTGRRGQGDVANIISVTYMLRMEEKSISHGNRGTNEVTVNKPWCMLGKHGQGGGATRLRPPETVEERKPATARSGVTGRISAPQIIFNGRHRDASLR